MSEKYLQEIEEILREAEEAPPRHPQDGETPPQSSGRYVLRPPRMPSSRSLFRVTPSKMIMAAMAILLLSIVIGGAFGLQWLFVGFVLGLLVVAYLMFFARPGQPRIQKRWRGRPVDDEPDDPASRFNRWMKR